MRTRTEAQARWGRSARCGGLCVDQRRNLWHQKYIPGDKLNEEFLALNYQYRLMFCLPKGKQRQKYLTDQNLCALRWLVTTSQRYKSEEKRMIDE